MVLFLLKYVRRTQDFQAVSPDDVRFLTIAVLNGIFSTKNRKDNQLFRQFPAKKN